MTLQRKFAALTGFALMILSLTAYADSGLGLRASAPPLSLSPQAANGGTGIRVLGDRLTSSGTLTPTYSLVAQANKFTVDQTEHATQVPAFALYYGWSHSLRLVNYPSQYQPTSVQGGSHTLSLSFLYPF